MYADRGLLPRKPGFLDNPREKRRFYGIEVSFHVFLASEVKFRHNASDSVLEIYYCRSGRVGWNMQGSLRPAYRHLRQAMKLLRETNDTIADIASQVGYQTQGKFSSAFQSIVKMSSREYRKIQGIAPSDFFSKTL